LLLATARARCVFVHVALSVRLPSPRALHRNAYIYRARVCGEVGGWFCSSVTFAQGCVANLAFFPRDWACFCNELRINFTTCRLLVLGLILLLPLIFWAYMFAAHLI